MLEDKLDSLKQTIRKNVKEWMGVYSSEWNEQWEGVIAWCVPDGVPRDTEQLCSLITPDVLDYKLDEIIMEKMITRDTTIKDLIIAILEQEVWIYLDEQEVGIREELSR